MSITTWTSAMDEVRDFVFQIKTPYGAGTGFVISYLKGGRYCGIATAHHVIRDALEWETPVRLTHYATKKMKLFKPGEYSVSILREKDLAFILINKGALELPERPLPLPPEGRYLKQGVEVGWCGFPVIAPEELCFFSGHISCVLREGGSYLVDGVAINGVSGGPTFVPFSGKHYLCGLITAYIPNQATGKPLPGMSVITSIQLYQELLEHVKSPEEAKEKIETAVSG